MVFILGIIADRRVIGGSVTSLGTSWPSQRKTTTTSSTLCRLQSTNTKNLHTSQICEFLFPQYILHLGEMYFKRGCMHYISWLPYVEFGWKPRWLVGNIDLSGHLIQSSIMIEINTSITALILDWGGLILAGGRLITGPWAIRRLGRSLILFSSALQPAGGYFGRFRPFSVTFYIHDYPYT